MKYPWHEVYRCCLCKAQLYNSTVVHVNNGVCHYCGEKPDIIEQGVARRISFWTKKYEYRWPN